MKIYILVIMKNEFCDRTEFITFSLKLMFLGCKAIKPVC